MSKLNLDEREIIRLYTEENKTCKQIGKMFNCSLATIHRRLNNNNINTSYKGKLKSEKHKENMRKPKSVPNKNKGKTYEEIYGKEKAKEVTNKNPLKLKFTLKQEKEIIRLPARRRTTRRRIVVKRGVRRSPRYERELLGSKEIGKVFNCGEKPIFRILKKYNINTKQSHRLKLLYKKGNIKPNSGCFREGMMEGKKNPAWLGGKSFEHYGIEFNKKLKKIVRERDGCCMVCNVGFEDLKLLKRRVHIHHINYDKQCNLIHNLISLCNNCHMKTNYNRISWTKFFQSLLSERYNYQYSENQEIILNYQGGD